MQSAFDRVFPGLAEAFDVMSEQNRAEVIAFLEDARAHPEDDTPLLILADWLEEHDDEPRATLIRLQCRAARLELCSSEQRELEREAALLVEQHRDSWLGPLRALRPGDVTFERGLVRFSCHTDDLERWAREACSWQESWAWVWQVRLRGRGGPGLFTLPVLRMITSLDRWREPMGVVGAEALVMSPHLTQLVSLNLGYTQLGDAGAAVLADSPHLAGLQTLHLGSNGIGDAGAQALARSPHLARLKELYLGYNEIGDVGAQALAESASLTQLATLHLRQNRIGWETQYLLRRRFGNAEVT